MASASAAKYQESNTRGCVCASYVEHVSSMCLFVSYVCLDVCVPVYCR